MKHTNWIMGTIGGLMLLVMCCLATLVMADPNTIVVTAPASEVTMLDIISYLVMHWAAMDNMTRAAVVLVGLLASAPHVAALTPWKWDDWLSDNAGILGKIVSVAWKFVTGNYLHAATPAKPDTNA